MRMRRIGIYSGTFDPVHAGHIAFALQAAKAARLDMVYFMPERRPRGKRYITHYAHRVSMIRRAARPYGQLAVLETEDNTFSTLHTLPRLRQRFADAQLVYMCGSDVAAHMAEWPDSASLLAVVELCVGVRSGIAEEAVEAALARLPAAPRATTLVQSYVPFASSRDIRAAIREKRRARGLLASVQKYANQEWLYL